MPRLLIYAFLLCVFLPTAAFALQSQDICVGNGTPGPYSLSWKQVTSETESVQINGLPQMRGLDYALDAAAGTVTFTRRLAARSAAEISYSYDPALAQRSSAGQPIPLSVYVLHNATSSLSVDALSTPSDGTVMLGAGFGWQGSHHAQIATHVFFAPGSGTLGPAGSGLSVNASTDTTRDMQFSFGLARASVGLTEAADEAVRAGQQTLTLGSRCAPSETVQASAAYTRTDPTAGSPTVSSSQASLSVAMKPTQRINLETAFSQNMAAHSGSTKDMQVKMSALANSTVSVEASAGRTEQGGMTTDQQAISLSLTPYSALQLTTGLSLRRQNALSASIASVSGTLRPLSFLELSGTYKDRAAPGSEANPGAALDTSVAQVSLAPLKTLRLTGNYAQNPDTGDWSVQRLAQRGVGMETSLGALGLSGGYDWARTYDTPDVTTTVHADLGLRFSPATQLTFGYRTVASLTGASPETCAYTLAFSHRLGSGLDVTVQGKQEASGASPQYNAEASLGLKF